MSTSSCILPAFFSLNPFLGLWASNNCKKVVVLLWGGVTTMQTHTSLARSLFNFHSQYRLWQHLRHKQEASHLNSEENQRHLSIRYHSSFLYNPLATSFSCSYVKPYTNQQNYLIVISYLFPLKQFLLPYFSSWKNPIEDTLCWPSYATQ